MIPSDIELRREMIEHMINYLIGNVTLTKGEIDFIESITEQFDEKKNLTDRQCEIFERIYDKI